MPEDQQFGALTQARTEPSAMAATAAGGNPLQQQLFQQMMDQGAKKQDYLTQRQEAYNTDLNKYAQMVQNSQQPGYNEAQMWGSMAKAAALAIPNQGTLGSLLAHVGGAYGDSVAQENANNLRNQAELTKLRQAEVRALESKDQNAQMLKAIGVSNKALTPEQLRTVYSSARNEAAQIAKDYQWNSAQQRSEWIEQHAKKAVDEYRKNYLLDSGASYGVVTPNPPAPAPNEVKPEEKLEASVTDSLKKQLDTLSVEDKATAVRLLNRIASNPNSASNDGRTLQNILDKYSVKTSNIVEPAPLDKAAEAAKKAKAISEAEPIPATALKMQQEELESIGLTSSINDQLTNILSDLKEKKLDLGPVSNLVSKGKNWTGFSDEGSQKYANMMSTLEKMRNDSLRLNKGVQTEGDAQRAWNELFANVNDPEVVKSRLETIMKLNETASEKRKANVNLLRKNYGKEPLDFSIYEQEKQREKPKSSAPAEDIHSRADAILSKGKK